ncbi:hypothetical protein OF83DRAFT_1179145 [Amylostereum chailletii]|nr:hypothetical protein OF83DRAFT_1179145 [Amylostereum chailletii]
MITILHPTNDPVTKAWHLYLQGLSSLSLIQAAVDIDPHTLPSVKAAQKAHKNALPTEAGLQTPGDTYETVVHSILAALRDDHNLNVVVVYRCELAAKLSKAWCDFDVRVADKLLNLIHYNTRTVLPAMMDNVGWAYVCMECDIDTCARNMRPRPDKTWREMIDHLAKEHNEPTAERPWRLLDDDETTFVEKHPWMRASQATADCSCFWDSVSGANRLYLMTLPPRDGGGVVRGACPILMLLDDWENTLRDWTFFGHDMGCAM